MKKNILFLAFIFFSLIVLHAQELKFSDCYGKWKIDKAFIVSEDFLVIGDMAKEEAESYIGKVITYRPNEFELNETIFKYSRDIRKYSTNVTDYFYDKRYWHGSFKEFGITEERFNRYSIDIKDYFKYENQIIIGDSIIQLNKNELLIVKTNWYFHAVRFE